MSSIEGVLVECDPTVCEYIKHLDKDRGFIIKALDDHHLFIDSSMTKWIQMEVEKLLDSYTFKKVHTS